MAAVTAAALFDIEIGMPNFFNQRKNETTAVVYSADRASFFRIATRESQRDFSMESRTSGDAGSDSSYLFINALRISSFFIAVLPACLYPFS